MESIYFVIPAIVIILMIIPIRIKVMVSYNPLNNIGSFALYIWKKQLQRYLFKFKGRYMLIRYEHKRKEVKLTYNGPQMKFYNQLNVQLKDKVRIRKLEIFTKVGVNDAFYSAIFSATVSAIASMFVGYVKNSKPTCNVEIKNFTAFNEVILQGVINAKISISLFDILYSFIMAHIIIRRKEKYTNRVIL